MAIDWLAATVEQRKTLYRLVRRLMADEAISWSDLYREALGRSASPGGGYEDNFRAGRIARQTANQIYRWLAQHHPGHAAKLNRELGAQATAGERWRSFLQAHGRFERVAAVLLPEPSIGIVSFARPEPLARPVIPLGAPFCFEIESDRQSAVIAFQHAGGNWHRLPLRPDGVVDMVMEGRQYLPRQADGAALALSEDAQEGRHGFLFLLGEPALMKTFAAIPPAGAIPATMLDGIAQTLEPHRANVLALRINLLFVR